MKPCIKTMPVNIIKCTRTSSYLHADFPPPVSAPRRSIYPPRTTPEPAPHLGGVSQSVVGSQMFKNQVDHYVSFLLHSYLSCCKTENQHWFNYSRYSPKQHHSCSCFKTNPILRTLCVPHTLHRFKEAFFGHLHQILYQTPWHFIHQIVLPPNLVAWKQCLDLRW